MLQGDAKNSQVGPYRVRQKQNPDQSSCSHCPTSATCLHFTSAIPTPIIRRIAASASSLPACFLASRLTMTPIPKALSTGWKHWRSGQLEQAEQIARQILNAEPGNA